MFLNFHRKIVLKKKINPVEVGNKKYKRSTVPWRSLLVLVWCFRFDFELCERYLCEAKFSLGSFLCPAFFSRESSLRSTLFFT